MPSAPTPPGEAARLAALAEYGVLDTTGDRAFDDLVQLASRVCRAPISLVTLIDATRQWILGRKGLELEETTREVAFCSHAILETEPLVVTDARRDPRFAGNPLVTGAPFIRFYAGAPLLTRSGQALGSLCVIDREPRRLDPDQLATLEALARQAVALLELRRVARALAEALATSRALGKLLPMCAWCRRIRDDGAYWASVEEYLRHHDTEVSHGICPECASQHFPDRR